MSISGEPRVLLRPLVAARASGGWARAATLHYGPDPQKCEGDERSQMERQVRGIRSREIMAFAVASPRKRLRSCVTLGLRNDIGAPPPVAQAFQPARTP